MCSAGQAVDNGLFLDPGVQQRRRPLQRVRIAPWWIGRAHSGHGSRCMAAHGPPSPSESTRGRSRIISSTPRFNGLTPSTTIDVMDDGPMMECETQQPVKEWKEVERRIDGPESARTHSNAGDLNLKACESLVLPRHHCPLSEVFFGSCKIGDSLGAMSMWMDWNGPGAEVKKKTG